MSAFVIDSATMDKVVRAICTARKYQSHRQFFGHNVSKPENWSKIGQMLFSLNIEAVQQRYPDTLDCPDRMPGGDIMVATAYRFREYPVLNGFADKVACYKAMRCLRYQASEGDADQSGIYAALDAEIAAFAQQIIEDSPEYNAAGW